jgi:hypothetical protein
MGGGRVQAGGVIPAVRRAAADPLPCRGHDRVPGKRRGTEAAGAIPMEHPTYRELELALRARVPLVALLTHEEARAEEQFLVPLARAWRGGRIFGWSTTRDFEPLLPPEEQEEALPLRHPAPEPLAALEAIAAYELPALFVLRDFHHWVDNAAVMRRLRELAATLPSAGKQVVFLGHRFRAPDDLEKEIHLVDLPPPGRRELDGLLEALSAAPPPGITGHAVQLSPEGRERFLRAALGLTRTEAETVLARALVRDGALTDAGVELVLAEKRQLVRRSGILEFYEAKDDLGTVGGLAVLKAWLRRRVAAFSEDAREYGLPLPRGILLLGVQGCGKSLVARAVSREWAMPLLRLDVGRVFGKYIGESEAAIRRAIHTAEAAAPCLLWIDELEKGFAGAASEAHDTGVSARVLGTFLTWMQEKEAPVFVVATANQIRNLPAELLRKGRFDELFFVDLPALEERAEIFAVHLRKRRRDPGRFDLQALAAATEGFTGAEIEQLVTEALYTAYADGRREPAQADLLHAAGEIIPLSVTMREALHGMRQWAQSRARRAS